MNPFNQAFKGLIRETVEIAVEQAVGRISPQLSVAERDRPAKEWLTNTEAQAYLGLSKATLARYRADGILPYSKVGQSIYYRLDAIESLLERHAVGRTSADVRSAGDGAATAPPVPL